MFKLWILLWPWLSGYELVKHLGPGGSLSGLCALTQLFYLRLKCGYLRFRIFCLFCDTLKLFSPRSIGSF